LMLYVDQLIRDSKSAIPGVRAKTIVSGAV